MLDTVDEKAERQEANSQKGFISVKMTQRSRSNDVGKQPGANDPLNNT